MAVINVLSFMVMYFMNVPAAGRVPAAGTFWFYMFALRHWRQAEAVVVGVFNPFVGHVEGVELGKAPVELRVAVDNCVFVDRYDFLNSAKL